jgi:hypothetical protein
MGAIAKAERRAEPPRFQDLSNTTPGTTPGTTRGTTPGTSPGTSPERRARRHSMHAIALGRGHRADDDDIGWDVLLGCEVARRRSSRRPGLEVLHSA